jgi:hypothetical protein
MSKRVNSTARILKRLEKIKTTFTPAAKSERLELLISMAKHFRSSPLKSARHIESYHDLLSFARAYPDSPAILALVERELRNFNKRIDIYKTATKDKQATELDDTGIINTSVSNAFSYEMTRFIAETYPALIEIDWDAIEEAGVDNISGILGQLVTWQENDTLDNDEKLETKDWLTIGRTRKLCTELQVLLALIDNPAIPYLLRKHLYESAEIPVRWRLTKCQGSRTLLRLPSHGTFYQSEPILPRTRNLRSDLAKSAVPLRKISSQVGSKYVRAIREVLASRVRELYPLTNSNPDEVYLAEPGRGVQIVIFGNHPRVRLPLEGNFGALLVRNGLPIGYGVAAVIFDRVEIAINIFPAFRSGESSFVIEHFFRLFHHHFGAKSFLVRAYQIGDDNEEALESGSFWFYYKLGFRPVKTAVRALAEREALKVANISGYRSSLRTLKRLAKSDVFFDINELSMKGFDEFSLINLGKVITRLAATRYGGNRQQMEIDCERRLLRILGKPLLTRWTDDERTALRRLAPLLVLIPTLKKWPRQEKSDLAAIIRAKGAVCEKQFVALSQKHPRLSAVLREMSANIKHLFPPSPRLRSGQARE